MKKKRTHHAQKRKRIDGPIREAIVVVTSSSFGGDGIAKQDGKVIFIAGAVPGETLKVAIYEDKKSFAKARILEKICASPDEIPSFCPAFDRCGGCQWQHVPYQKQLAWKADFIQSALRKFAGYEQLAHLQVKPSPAIRNFRNRIKLKVQRNQSTDDLKAGYFAKSSHDFIPVKSCPIAEEEIDRELADLPHAQWQTLQDSEVELQVLSDRQLLFSSHSRSRELPSFQLLEIDEGISYFTQPGQFQQINLAANRQLRAWIKAEILAQGCENILDLYCGSGNFSLGLVKAGLKVWGLEISELAIETAQHNVAFNSLEGGDYRAGPSDQLKSIFPDFPDQLDALIADPPRQGMIEALPLILQLAPRHLFYVSCDPNTFARDLKVLLAGGYIVRELFGMDFFPHSYHVESIVRLERDLKRSEL